MTPKLKISNKNYTGLTFAECPFDKSRKMFYPNGPLKEWARPQNGRFISCKSGRARVKYGKGRKGGREESG